MGIECNRHCVRLQAIAWSKLKRVGLDSYLRFGAFGSDAIERSDLIELAIERASKDWSFSGGEEVFFFGDTPRDVKAGKETGVKTVALMTGIYTRLDLERAGADVIFDDLTDRESILRYLLG